MTATDRSWWCIVHSRRSGSGKKRYVNGGVINGVGHSSALVLICTASNTLDDHFLLAVFFVQLKGFHNIVLARSLREGCQHLFQVFMEGGGNDAEDRVGVSFCEINS